MLGARQEAHKFCPHSDMLLMPKVMQAGRQVKKYLRLCGSGRFAGAKYNPRRWGYGRNLGPFRRLASDLLSNTNNNFLRPLTSQIHGKRSNSALPISKQGNYHDRIFDDGRKDGHGCGRGIAGLGDGVRLLNLVKAGPFLGAEDKGREYTLSRGFGSYEGPRL